MKVLVYGNGLTGKSVKKFFRAEDVKVFDDDVNKTEIDGSAIGRTFVPDLVILSPSVSRSSAVVAQCEKVGAYIRGEAEYFLSNLCCKVVSVTGTNGKTTVTKLTEHILRQNGFSAFAVGNCGIPVSSVADKVTNKTILVCETSSFMLAQSCDFAPDVAVMTNFGEDHLNFHGTMQKYFEAKCRNFSSMKRGVAVFNADDKPSRLFSDVCRIDKLFFSLQNPLANCVWKDNLLFDFGDVHDEANCPQDQSLPTHMLSDTLCAFSVCRLLGVRLADCLSASRSFKSDAHRLQKICDKDGVSFIDDSKATNVDSATAAMRSVGGKLFVILGGSDKGCSFDGLFENFDGRATFCAVGATAEKIKACAKKFDVDVEIVADLKQAVEKGYEKMQGGGTVLLAPACASFDVFENYAERGRRFAEICLSL